MGNTKSWTPTGSVTVNGNMYGNVTTAMPAVDGTTSVELTLSSTGQMVVRFGQSSAISATPNGFDLSLNPGAVVLLEGGIHPLAAAAASATYIAVNGAGSLTVSRGNTTNFAY